MGITILINVAVWLVLILYLIRSTKVIYECRAGAKFVIVIIFFVIAISQYLRYRDTLALYTCGSLMIAGVLYTLVKSGFTKDGFVVLGRLYPYSKVNQVKVERKDNQVFISFRHKKRTVYLFANASEELKVRELIQEYYYR